MARKSPLGKIKDAAVGTLKLPVVVAEKAVGQASRTAVAGVDVVTGLVPGRKPSSKRTPATEPVSATQRAATPVRDPGAPAASRAAASTADPSAPAAKEAPAKKTPTKKAATKKAAPVATEAPAKKAAPVATKAPAKKAPAKKAAAKKAPVKKAPVKKAPAKKAPTAADPADLGLEQAPPTATTVPEPSEPPVTSIDADAASDPVDVTPADVSDAMGSEPKTVDDPTSTS